MKDKLLKKRDRRADYPTGYESLYFRAGIMLLFPETYYVLHYIFPCIE